MQQYGIDRTQLTTDQPNDQAIANVPAAQVLPEANFGVWLQHQNKYYVGFSATNLVQTKRFINVNPYNVYNQVKRTYYLMGGYRFKLSEHMVLEPSAMLQTMESLLKLSFKKGDFAIPFQTDINSRLIFNNLFYFGVSYRVKDAIVGMAGIQKPSFRIGYSYDYTLSGLTNYNSGSHEIGLTLFLESVPRGDGNMKIKRGEQIPRRTLQFKRD